MKQKYVTIKIIISLVVIGAGLNALISIMSQSKDTDESNAKNVAQGAKIYQQHCATCHGNNLEGQPNWKTRNGHGRLPAPPHDETGHTWHHSDQLLFELTKYGMVPPNIPEGYESDMPAYRDILSDEEIRAVLAYIKSRWPDEIVKVQSERN